MSFHSKQMCHFRGGNAESALVSGVGKEAEKDREGSKGTRTHKLVCARRHSSLVCNVCILQHTTPTHADTAGMINDEQRDEEGEVHCSFHPSPPLLLFPAGRCDGGMLLFLFSKQ